MENYHKKISCNKSLDYPEYYDIADQIIEVSKICTDNLHARSINEYQLTRYQFILMFNYFKASNSFLSAIILCDKGLVGDAKTICRKLIEIMISMSYLAQDRENRQHLYWNYLPIILQKEYNKKLQVQSNHPEVFYKMLNDISRGIDEMSKKVKEYWDDNKPEMIKNAYKRQWSGKSIEAMAKECGLAYSYYYPYVEYCRATHSSIDDILNYVDFKEMSFNQFKEIDDIPFVMYDIILSYWSLNVLVNDAFTLALCGSLQKIIDNLKSINYEKLASFHKRS